MTDDHKPHLNRVHTFTQGQFSKDWMWCVESQAGTAHLHIREYPITDKEPGVSGGIEMHWRSPPSYRLGDAPDHNPCPVLKGPCWHGGSLLAAGEAIKQHRSGTLSHEEAFWIVEQFLIQQTNEDSTAEAAKKRARNE